MTQSNTTILDVDLSITTASHYLDDVEITKVNVNQFPSDAADTLATLIGSSVNTCIRDVSDFLLAENLPYIY